MNKMGLFSILGAVVAVAALSFFLHSAYIGLAADASTHGLAPLAWLEIKRDLDKCGSEIRERKCVVEGGGGWLFYHESLLDLARPWEDNAPSIIAFRDSLAARGVALIVVPVPDKLQVEADKYLRYTRTDLVPKAYREWIARLQSAGVSVVDAMDAFRSARDSVAMFEPYESHYTAQGRALLAKLVADTLQRILPQEPRISTYDIQMKPEKGSGNLFHLRYNRYRPYKVEESVVIDKTSGANYHDNRKAPVVIIGDSNAGHGLQYSSHIGALIAAKSGLPTFTISKVGAGNTGPRVFKGKARFLASKKAVIWVFDGRELYGRFGMPEF